MKNLKNLMTTVTLLAILVIGTGSANAGILMSDFTGGQEDPCTEGPTKYNSGILMSDFTGVILHGFGVILHGFGTDKGGDGQVDCGILMSD
jgi:hypothetical protein